MKDDFNVPNEQSDKPVDGFLHLTGMFGMPWTLWDKNYNIIDCSTEAVKMFGVSSKQEYFDRFDELSPKHQQCGALSRERFLEMLKIAFKKGECVFEWMHQTLNGDSIPVKITLFRSSKENDVMVFGYIRDLSEDIEAKQAVERMRIMLDTVPLCCNYWDENFNNIDCNQAAVDLFDLPSKKEYLERFFELSPMHQPDGMLSSEKALIMIKKAFNDGKCVFEWMHQKLNGEPVPSEITLISVVQESGTIVVGYTQDLRESIRAKQADDRMRTMFDTVPLCCNYWDENLNNIDCNQEAVKLFDLSCKDEYLNRFNELSPAHQPDGMLSSEKAVVMIKKAFEEGKCVFEWMHQKLSGEPIPAEVTLIKDEVSNIVLGYTHDLRGIREAVERLDNMEQLVNLANVDYLTDCYNRRGISKVLDKVNDDFCIIMMDLDHFKNVNDSFGHSVGDEVLINFVNLAKGTCRSTDTVIRYGGEEFLVILLNTSLEIANIVAEKIRKKTEEKLLLPDGSKITVSIGIAKREQNEIMEHCINRADRALYKSKNSGRNTITVCDKNLQ